jgi:60 kDa SS-A/Ro ribonucleoprotein
MANALKGFSTRKTPQSRPAGGATVENAAGGFVYGIDDYARVRRFLVLGTDGGTYYTSAQALTRDNADAVVRLAKSDPISLVDMIVEISLAGRAPKQDQAIFALAIAASEPEKAELRQYALSKLNEVCRTGTHVFQFVGYVEQFRGWGPQLKRAVANWYLKRPLDKLAYQAVKYRQREDWTHRDLLRLSRPCPETKSRDALFAWICGKSEEEAEEAKNAQLPQIVHDYETAKHIEGSVAPSEKSVWLELAASGRGLSWEMFPDAALKEAEVWEALIHQGLPQTALMRQLPRLTNLGLTTGATGKVLAEQLTDVERLKRGRVHPINVLVAQRTYAWGVSARGKGTWTPTAKITDALDSAFYAAYGAVEPAGKKTLLALDVSGSMGSPAGGLPITCREAAAALALVTLNTEPDADVIGFSDGQQVGRGRYSYNMYSQSVASRLDISPRRRLDDVCSYTAGLNFGRTDCALPMIWANSEGENYDTILVITDNETWYGQMHPHQALKLYREKYGETRFVVVAMTSTGYSIADPADKHSLDVVGFDSAVPTLISSFSRGDV